MHPDLQAVGRERDAWAWCGLFKPQSPPPWHTSSNKTTRMSWWQPYSYKSPQRPVLKWSMGWKGEYSPSCLPRSTRSQGTVEHLLKCFVPTKTQPFFSLERPWGPHLVHFNWRPVYKEEGQHRGEVSHLTTLLNRTVVKKDVRVYLTQMWNCKKKDCMSYSHTQVTK